MAEINQDTASTHPEHNVEALKKLLRECGGEMLKIKERRKELNAEAAEIRQRVKDAGVQVDSFDRALKIAELEAEARASYMDSFRVAYEALVEGEQMDWLDADAA